MFILQAGKNINPKELDSFCLMGGSCVEEEP
jgi:hypothetical protein